MLPSKGYFQGNECPFHELRICFRPHCHYKHSRREKKVDKEEEPLVKRQKIDVENQEDLSYKPTPISELKRHIPVACVPAKPTVLYKKEKQVWPNSFKASERKEYRPEGNISGVTYKPTKLSETEYRPEDAVLDSTSEKYPYRPRIKSVKEEYKPEKAACSATYTPSQILRPNDIEAKFSDDDEEITKPSDESSIEIESEQIKIEDLLEDEKHSSQENTTKKQDSDKNISDKPLNLDKNTSEKHSQSGKISSKHSSSDKHKNAHKSSRKSSDSDKKKKEHSNHSKSSDKHSSSEKKRTSGTHSDKKLSSSGEKHSSSDKKHSSSDKKHSSSDKKHSSSHKKHSSSNKKHSSSHKKSDGSRDEHSSSEKEISEKHTSSHKKSDGTRDEHSSSEKEISEKHSSSHKHHTSRNENSSSEKEKHPSFHKHHSSREKHISSEKDTKEEKNKIEPIDLDEDSDVGNYSEDNVVISDSSEEEKNEIKRYIPSIASGWLKPKDMMNRSNAPKIRIASVPNVSSLLNAKKSLLASKPAPKPVEEEYTPTPIKRVAHAAPIKTKDYPKPIFDNDIKIPNHIRQQYMNTYYEELYKYYAPDEAKSKAIEEELSTAKRVHVIKTYQNSMLMAKMKVLKNYEKETEEKAKPKVKLSSQSSPSFTFGLTLYECFAKYILTEDELKENGYPLKIKNKPRCAYIWQGARINQPISFNQDFRICVNCKKTFYIDEHGYPTSENDCQYHWGRLYKMKTAGGWVEKYICCNGELHSEPCESSRFHISNSFDEDCLEGFVTTKPLPDGVHETYAGIYALDCEMCYTTRGPELTRVTLIDLNGKVAYDEVVVPDNPILDYCTRFSGITEQMVTEATLKLKDVQRKLLTIIFDKTILIGHSLENDLKSLRILHNCVVDTAVTFPHRKGLPYKRALKTLAKEILQRTIQESITGHDSCEDASTCLDLMMAKVKEDAKVRKPRTIISLKK